MGQYIPLSPGESTNKWSSNSAASLSQPENVYVVNDGTDLGKSTDFGSTNFGDWFLGQAGNKEQATRQSYLDTMEWLRNVASAREQRSWEEYMSNTEIQRKMADIKAAGLNPWLALQSAGFGGSVPSGAAASSSAGQVASSGSNSLAGFGSAALGIAALIKTIAAIVK